MPIVSTASAPRTTRHLPHYVSLALLGSLVAAYFFWPAFQAGVQEGFVCGAQERRAAAHCRLDAAVWLLGPVVLVPLMVVQMFLFVVNVVALIQVAVLAYGPWWGCLLALAGNVVASAVGYGLGRLLGESFVSRILGQKTEHKVLDVVHRYGMWAIVIARLSPAFSDDAISFVAGVARLGYWKFMAATLAGVVPLIALLAYLGEESNRLKTGLV